MNAGLISTRYASSLLDYAIELGQQEEVYRSMKTLSEIFVKVPRLGYTLLNPSLSASEKKKLLTTASGGNLSSSLDKMIDLILMNDREESIRNIALRFIDLYRNMFNIHPGKLVTAFPVDEETQKHLIIHTEEAVGGTIEFESIIDPSIMGGFMLSVGDYRWDASVAGELNRIRNKLKEANKKIV